MTIFLQRLNRSQQAGRLELNLMAFVDRLLEALDFGLQVGTVYKDFSKAFDTTNHKLLLRNLCSFVIDGLLLRWLGNYLMYREQYVRVNHSYSYTFPVPPEVPRDLI